MVFITNVKARQVFDSRGTPTIEAEVHLSGGAWGRFITPSGASVGKKEALELRDGDAARFFGKGVSKALANIEQHIKKVIVEKSFHDSATLDRCLIELDATPNKTRLGANAILAVSGAFFRAIAEYEKRPLYQGLEHKGPFIMPMPLVNVINGGAHANNGLAIQEFMMVPVGASSFSEAMRMMAESFYALKTILHKTGLSTAVGDEGGFAPNLATNEQALLLLQQAVEKAGYTPGKHIAFALDVAASEIYDEATQTYRMDGQQLRREQVLDFYGDLINRFPIISIEDPFAEDDKAGFALMTKQLGSRVQVVGDDLFVTNQIYIKEGIENRYANAVLIKINQIGTISEAIQATKLTQEAGLKAIMSHRSGDTEDTTIADLAVLTGTGQIKTGSMSRSERIAKYNRLLRIEEELAGQAQFKHFWSGK